MQNTDLKTKTHENTEEGLLVERSSKGRERMDELI
jgi:hypothetical protein